MDSTDNPFMRKEEWRKMETEIKLYHEKKKKKKKVEIEEMPVQIR